MGSSFALERNKISQRFNNKKFEIFPSVEAEYSFNPTKKLSVSLSRGNEFVRMEELMTASTVGGYNEVLNRSQVESPYQSAYRLLVTYFSYDIEKQTYLTVYANAETASNVVVPNISQEGIVSKTTYTNGGRSDNIYAIASLDKRMKRIPVNIKGSLSVSYLKSPSVFNDEDYTTKTYSFLSKVSIQSRFQSKFNGELALNYSHNRSDISGANTKNTTANLSGQFKLLFSSGAWQCQTAVDYQYINGDSYENNNIDFGIKIEYKLKRVTLRASAENLLHLKDNEWWRTITTAYYITNERFKRMPGYIMFGATWKI